MPWRRETSRTSRRPLRAAPRRRAPRRQPLRREAPPQELKIKNDNTTSIFAF
jgi:hypothetical protein